MTTTEFAELLPGDAIELAVDRAVKARVIRRTSYGWQIQIVSAPAKYAYGKRGKAIHAVSWVRA
jgi:hypothetical protein